MVSIVGFVCTTTSDFSAINIVGCMALAEYRNFPTFSGVFFDYVYSILQLAISLIKSNFFCRWVVSRGTASLVVFWFFCRKECSASRK